MFEKWFSRPERRVLCVCTANVCRSTIAEALLKHHLKRAGMERQIAVSSAGTRVGQPGRSADIRSVTLLRDHQVPVPRMRATPLTREILDQQDLVLVMEDAHAKHVKQLAAGAQCHVRLLGEFNPGMGENPNIPDPYFGPPLQYRQVYALIDEAVARLVDRIVDGDFPT